MEKGSGSPSLDTIESMSIGGEGEERTSNEEVDGGVSIELELL